MPSPCLVLGVGITLWADEGVGPRLIEVLSQRFDIPGAELVDGGTQGLYLLPIVSEAERLLVFDAVRLGHAPGTVVVLQDGEIDTVFRGALSLHQTTLHDLLGSARLIGQNPRQVVLIGVEAEDTENWGGNITITVARAMEEALRQAEAVLRGWGLSLIARSD
ncbi:MAG: HyaD/HybD family hydrogenase maturation endopeptidase [Bradyrhizobium sp.]|uniref:HyaD/HybD family hydrogenase maturation endopeptidase n=1 Tax=Bradyrhizobium sp. TaxID=376 RepID=UPI0025C07C24|nr:HyaD/HybD family hydrogenase maturation endopeptidase [Bradyrhizobium sp.]MBI5260243.1 HyaD/HybD family hydrogenase maturation endopeptidase [Bradyrhizobium sp.]